MVLLNVKLVIYWPITLHPAFKNEENVWIDKMLALSLKDLFSSIHKNKNGFGQILWEKGVKESDCYKTGTSRCNKTSKLGTPLGPLTQIFWGNIRKTRPPEILILVHQWIHYEMKWVWLKKLICKRYSTMDIVSLWST